MNFCDEDILLDVNITLNTTNVKSCKFFLHLVFQISPCLFLWIFALPYSFITQTSKFGPIPISHLFRAKLASTVLIWIFSWIDLILIIWQWCHGVQNLTSLDFLVPVVLGSSMALVTVLLHFDRVKGVRSSGLLTMFWLLCIVLWAIVCTYKIFFIISTAAISTAELARSITWFMCYGAAVVNTVLCFVSDKRPTVEIYDGAKLLQHKHKFVTSHSTHVACPKAEATFLSKMFFHWFTKLAILGFKQPLTNKHLWKLDKQFTSSYVTNSFLKTWNTAKTRLASSKKSSPIPNLFKIKEKTHTDAGNGRDLLLLKVICKTYGPIFLISSILRFFQICLTFVSPQILGALISFTNKDVPQWHGYFLAAFLFFIVTVQTIVVQQHMYVSIMVGLKMKSALVGAIYQKILVLSNSPRRHYTVGGVVNLMSVDVENLKKLLPELNDVWTAPFQIILGLYFLWQELGPSVFAGFAVIVLLVPVNGWIAKKLKALQVNQMKFKDTRIKFMSEVLGGIKVLKLYAWEISFQDKITEIRQKELKELRRAAYLNAASSFAFVCAPFMVSITTFAVYVLSDSHNVLDAKKAFVSLSLFHILRQPLSTIPSFVSSMVEAAVSLQRIEDFLNSQELDINSVDRRRRASDDVIAIKNANFRWDIDTQDVLKNISLSAARGSLIAIVGQIGSGKSSLISALLGDMEKRSGYVALNGTLAYVPQQAWIQNLTVRENITFGKKFKTRRYQRIVEDCELTADLRMLPAGDRTEIGERGINLSGGQKQRVAIARAVYHNAKVYLFDDPLSSVDSHVGKNIFDHVIGPNGRLKDKTRILVTHSLLFIPQADEIYVLKDGKISESGSYNELLARNGDFALFLKSYTSSIEEELPDEMDSSYSQSVPGITEKKEINVRINRTEVDELQPLINNSNSETATKQQKRAESELIPKEKAETGRVQTRVFASYLRSVGFLLSFFICLLYVMQNVALVFSKFWLAEWSDDPVNLDGTQNNTSIRLTVYSSLGLFQALLIVMSSFSMTYGSVAASAILHRSLLHRILRAPMRFFDTTPMGRILNRFSQDINVVDKAIPRTLNVFLMMSIQAISSFVVISCSTPLFAVVIVPLVLLYYFIQCFFTRTIRQLKRLESISRSPIYSHFTETFTGVTTIRAFNLQSKFVDELAQRYDENLVATYTGMVANRWIATQLQLIGNFIVLFAAIFAVNAKGKISAGTVGLSISYAIQVTHTLKRLVRQSSMLEANVVAVERILEYSCVEQEAPLFLDQDESIGEWPTKGEIKLNNYSTRYRPGLGHILQDLNVSIEGGEKIGVVGRTGAGKTSLTLGLFRIIEACKGSIAIDGINLADVGLHLLRSRLSIIPQDPVLFSGSVRINLDPFDKYSDEQIWVALEASHLKEFVTSLPRKLEHPVAEGGENLSVGQKQLICLARALLKKSKILILDEATAAVDLETDDLIQETIRSEFKHSTTLTIAHRLNTIMDSDRVIVIDAGEIIEFDSPANLITTGGTFYKMAKDAGLT